MSDAIDLTSGLGNGDTPEAGEGQAEFPSKIRFSPEEYHPDYAGQQKIISKNLAVFRGNDEGKEYLLRFEAEETKDYIVRKKATAFPNLCARVLSVYNYHLSSSAPNRELPEFLSSYLDDIDGDGTNVDAFFQSVVGGSVLPAGVSYLLVTKTAVSEDKPVTREQEQSLGLRPFVVHYDSSALLKWDYEEDGSMRYIVLRDSERHSDDWKQPHKSKSLLRVWTKTAWAVYEQESGSTGGHSDNYQLAATGLHPLKAVPLVAVYNIKCGRMNGKSEMTELGLADLNIDIFNKLSWLDQGLKYQGFPISVVNTALENLETMITGPGRGIKLNPDDKFQIHETSGAALGLLATNIRDKMRDFLDAAFRQVNPSQGTGANESGQSKLVDLSQLEASLQSKADNLDEAERQVWAFMALWLGKSLSPDELTAICKRRVEISPMVFRATVDEIGKLYSTYRMVDHETGIEMIRNGGQWPDEIAFADVEARLSQEEMSEQKALAATVSSQAKKAQRQGATVGGGNGGD